jgi:hypothetical protein
MGNLVERLYQYEDIEHEEALWRRPPFLLFNPCCQFLSFKPLVRTLEGKANFFDTDVKWNFFPDKTHEEAIEAQMYAMNRGIQALNKLCQTHLPNEADYLTLQEIKPPFNPIEYFREAREAWIQARSGAHKNRTESLHGLPIKQIDPKLLLRAYDSIRAWGLGHFVLVIDESPEVYYSVTQIKAINEWFSLLLGFRDPRPTEKGIVWQTNAGARTYGTQDSPFRHRAKIHDEQGKLRYDSLLMKMFLKGGFLEEVHDNYAIELLVDNDEDERVLLDFFRRTKSTGMLEAYKKFNDKGPPAFYRTKFIHRVAVRMPDLDKKDEGKADETGRCSTLMMPIKKYVRLPVEVQIRNMNHPYEHDLYKKLQYMRVFPLGYPKEIYAPLLETKARGISQ